MRTESDDVTSVTANQPITVNEMEIEKVTKEKEGDDEVTLVNEDEQQKPAHKTKRKKKEAIIIKPKREPTKEERKRMLAKAVEILIIETMKNHVYRFGNEFRVQSSGGPIGLSLTGEVADCMMIDWDKDFLGKLNTLGITPLIYERFKDDISVLTENIDKGSKYSNNRLEIDVEKKAKEQEPDKNI